MITKSIPGGDGTPTETKVIFSKYIFTESREECWNTAKNTSKGFQQDKKKNKIQIYICVCVCITRLLIGVLTTHSGVSVLLQAERSDFLNIAGLLT